MSKRYVVAEKVTFYYFVEADNEHMAVEHVKALDFSDADENAVDPAYVVEEEEESDDDA